MEDRKELRLVRWPFYLGDALMVAAACLVYAQSKPQMTIWAMVLAAGCLGVGGLFAIAPWLLEHRARIRLTEVETVSSSVSQIQKIEAVAAQIREATSGWYHVQEQANKTAAAAETITERMTTEVKAFTDFLQRANDSEKATLRLETEKLRRAESEWLQVLIRVLDHVYALHQAAVRSGQPNVIEQIGHFQNACRDAARRVGLAPFTAADAEPFDPQRHQALEGDGQPANGAVVGESVATGYTFQGRLLRPVLVRVAGPPTAEQALPSAPEPVETAGTAQTDLALGEPADAQGANILTDSSS